MTFEIHPQLSMMQWRWHVLPSVDANVQLLTNCCNGIAFLEDSLHVCLHRFLSCQWLAADRQYHPIWSSEGYYPILISSKKYHPILSNDYHPICSNIIQQSKVIFCRQSDGICSTMDFPEAGCWIGWLGVNPNVSWRRCAAGAGDWWCR